MDNFTCIKKRNSLNFLNIISEDSNGKRTFNLINEKGEIIKSKYCINSYELSDFLKDNKFYLIYYKNNNIAIPIIDIHDFFNNNTETNIYSLNNINLISRDDFNNSIEHLRQNKDSMEVDLTKIFLNFKDIFHLSFKNNKHKYFKEVEDFNYKKIFYNSSFFGPKTIFYEFFGINGIGITTTILLILKSFKQAGLHKFRPFLFIDFKSILNKSLKEFVDLFEFSISDLFMKYDEYITFFNSIKQKIYELYPNIFQVIVEIIKSFIFNKCGVNFYLPIVFISHYNKELDIKNEIKIIKRYLCSTDQFCLFIRYDDSTKVYNKKVIKYLMNKTKQKCIGYLYDNFYFIDFNEFNTKFMLTPRIKDVIKYENNLNVVDEKKKEISKIIDNFYTSNILGRNYYLNLINSLINTELELTKDIIELLNNIPLSLFSLGFIGKIEKKDKIQINYKCNICEELINKISEETILNIVDTNLYNNSKPFFKGCIFQKTIEYLIKSNKSSFGKFDYNKNIDCILNNLSLEENKNIDIILNDNEKIKELIQINQNEKINGNVYFYQINYFGKDFNIGIGKNEKLCCVNISLNKSIEKIKIILKDLDKKSDLILKKFNLIFGNIYHDFHILFILSQSQNIDTINFLERNKIPFIIFKQDKDKHFIFNNEKIFTDYTNYFKNKKIWENLINNDEEEKIISFKNNKSSSYEFIQRKIKIDENNDIYNKGYSSNNEINNNKLPNHVIRKLYKKGLKKEYLNTFYKIKTTNILIDIEINSIIVVRKKEKKINLFALIKKEKGEYEKIILSKKYKIDNKTLEELKKQEQDIYYFDIYKSK